MITSWSSTNTCLSTNKHTHNQWYFSVLQWDTKTPEACPVHQHSVYWCHILHTQSRCIQKVSNHRCLNGNLKRKQMLVNITDLSPFHVPMTHACRSALLRLCGDWMPRTVPLVYYKCLTSAACRWQTSNAYLLGSWRQCLDDVTPRRPHLPGLRSLVLNLR